MSPVRDDCKSNLAYNSYRGHSTSISPSKKWVFETVQYRSNAFAYYDSIQLFLFQYCYPSEHIYMTTLFSHSAGGMYFWFPGNDWGGAWSPGEDSVYFMVNQSTINTPGMGDTEEVFTMDVSSITGGTLNAPRSSSTPKLMKVSNHPNPFSRMTTINYSLPQEGFVAINIYNANGELIRVLGQEKQEQGNHSTYWDGRDNLGNSVATGVYYYQVISRDIISVKTMIKTK